MAPSKRSLRSYLLFLFGVAVAGLGLLAWRTDTTLLRRRLVRDIRALAEAPFPRPVQAPPVLPGRFGPRAAEAWLALAALEANARDVDFCPAMRGGETPVARAPESCLPELTSGAGALAALLLATHAEAAGPPAGLGALDVPTPKESPRTFVTAAYAARMAAFRLRADVARGEAEVALSTCADVLALARDTAWGTALAGRLAAVTVTDVVFAPCAAALDAAPAVAKRRAAASLALVEEGTPTLAETLSEWSTAVRAQLFAPYLASALPTLPPAVRSWAQGALVSPRGELLDAVTLGSRWHALQARLDALVEAARLPPGPRASRLRALSASPEPAFAPLGRLGFPDLGAVAANDAHARAEVLLLRRAAEVDALRAETGVWPRADSLPLGLRSTEAQPFSIEERGREAVLLDESSGRGVLEVLLHADG